MSRKPIAKVLVLDGPTHTHVLPKDGYTAFVPRTSILIYETEDLEFIKRVLPGGQIRLREFPRSLDIEPAVHETIEPEVAMSESETKKGRRR